MLLPDQDLILYQDSGAPSSAAIRSADTVSGIKITSGPSFGEAQGAEFINRRTARFRAEAEIIIVNTDAAVISFEETLVFFGSTLPRTIWRHAVNAGPVQQVVSPSTTLRIIQTGQAVGHRIRPTPPPPFWNYPIEQADKRVITYTAAKRIGPGAAGLIEPGVQWKYEYETDRALVALPNLPPY